MKTNPLLSSADVVGLRSCDIMIGDLNHTLHVLHAMFLYVEVNIRIHKTIQLFVQFGEPVVLLTFPEFVYLFISN